MRHFRTRIDLNSVTSGGLKELTQCRQERSHVHHRCRWMNEHFSNLTGKIISGMKVSNNPKIIVTVIKQEKTSTFLKLRHFDLVVTNPRLGPVFHTFFITWPWLVVT